MVRYALRRILQAIPLIFVISVVCFILIALAPYDAVDTFATPNMPQATINAMKARYGLDQPPWVTLLPLDRERRPGESGLLHLQSCQHRARASAASRGHRHHGHPGVFAGPSRRPHVGALGRDPSGQPRRPWVDRLSAVASATLRASGWRCS